MGLSEVAALIEADNRAAATAATFGHLAPTVGATYSGTIVFAHSPYGGDSVPLSVEFDNLPDSPWFYDGLCEFLSDHYADGTVGKVYRFEGSYQLLVWLDEETPDGYLTREAGHEHVFEGHIVELSLTAPHKEN